MAERNEEAVRRLVIRNPGPKRLEVQIEMIPDRYILEPDAEMIIEADLTGAPFHIVPWERGLTIYAGNDSEPLVTIDGMAVEPDWETPLD